MYDASHFTNKGLAQLLELLSMNVARYSPGYREAILLEAAERLRNS